MKRADRELVARQVASAIACCEKHLSMQYLRANGSQPGYKLVQAIEILREAVSVEEKISKEFGVSRQS